MAFEQLAAEAFTDEARARAAQHAAAAREAELHCARVLAERTRAWATMRCAGGWYLGSLTTDL